MTKIIFLLGIIIVGYGFIYYLSSGFETPCENFITLNNLNTSQNFEFDCAVNNTSSAKLYVTGNSSCDILLNIDYKPKNVTRQLNIKAGLIDTSFSFDWYQQVMYLKINGNNCNEEDHLNLRAIF